jgi:FtsP/CotA-like multicopper oxidase with cupredoxin domain
LFYPQVGINPEVNPYWNHAFLGNSIIVNGKSWPNLDVDQGQYRFRILDASNTRIYSLSFEDAETGQTIPFVQIGSDGGYLKNQVTLDEFIISPSERLDILVDFSGFAPGSKILMKNSLLTFDFPSEEQTIANIMQFTVTDQKGFDAKSLPELLNPTLEGDAFPTLPSPDNTRILTMFQVNGEQGPLIFLLNGQLWSGEVSELPRLGETEEWIIVDITNNAHPIHLHLVQFQVVGRQDIDAPRYAADWISLQREALQNATASPPWPVDFVPEELEVEPYLTGTFRGPALYELGWKDTALVYPNSITKIRARWTSQNGNPFSFDATDGPGYVWHCHLLEHEDNEMMRPYRVLPSVVAVSDFPLFEVSLVAGLAVLVVVLVLVFRRKRK